jgi:hypothetical protein
LEIELWRCQGEDKNPKKYLKEHFESQIEGIIQKNQNIKNLFDENRT